MAIEEQPKSISPPDPHEAASVMPSLLEPDFPASEASRARCREHLLMHFNEMMHDCLLQGLDFDAIDAGQETTLRFECPGRSNRFRSCRLSLVHYDEDGSELNRGWLV